jgi:hypothetical protein
VRLAWVMRRCRNPRFTRSGSNTNNDVVAGSGVNPALCRRRNSARSEYVHSASSVPDNDLHTAAE